MMMTPTKLMSILLLGTSAVTCDSSYAASQDYEEYYNTYWTQPQTNQVSKVSTLRRQSANIRQTLDTFFTTLRLSPSQTFLTGAGVSWTIFQMFHLTHENKVTLCIYLLLFHAHFLVPE